ncbi:hypothetical protein Rumeso_04949 [Rubellimicrobium mesophilum DSM 19309]|uniref:Uncharacterized protein n=1 Tax=Rubellimicrobium mesophilum DSM 19309 TaxID=442562 RepID=A0A017HBR3_9RHOB|nr:hypothetical protein [Rubellimicrobium mesophilum]EYD71548.1 hypothetical protein Rumeso_04949 [Rubellimicrobium mesophilum DSM 19309]
MLGWLGGLHRDAWRDAARLGVQAGVAGAVAYVVARWLGFVDPFLVIMMAVTGIERSVGGTLGQLAIRLQSALAGSLLGLLCLAVVPGGWGTAAALGLSLLVIMGASALRPSWALGVVPVVGMALGGDQGPLVETATTTSVGIVAGGAIGVVVAMLVWPDRAEARFERQFRRALRATATRLSDALEATVEEGREARVAEHVSAWGEAVWLAQEAMASAKFVDREGMRRRIEALRELHDSVIILDRAAGAEAAPAAGEGMRGEVEALRRETCEALTRMAEGRRAEAGIGEIDSLLSRLKAAVDAGEAVAPEHDAQTAVAFGLREVRRTLEALIEVEG